MKQTTVSLKQSEREAIEQLRKTKPEFKYLTPSQIVHMMFEMGYEKMRMPRA